jgi:hypothetical protein
LLEARRRSCRGRGKERPCLGERWHLAGVGRPRRIGRDVRHWHGHDRDAADQRGHACAAERKPEGELAEPREREGKQPAQPARTLVPRRRDAIREPQLLAQAPARAEDERLDGRHRKIELLGDLRVRAALDLAKEDHGALLGRQATDRCCDLAGGRALKINQAGGSIGVECDLVGPRRLHLVAAPDDIAGDRHEPGSRLLGLLPAPDRPECVHERDLRYVLGLVGIAHVPEDCPVDLTPVAAVKPLERSVPGR